MRPRMQHGAADHWTSRSRKAALHLRMLQPRAAPECSVDSGLCQPSGSCRCRPWADSVCCNTLEPSMIRGSSSENTVRGRLRATRAGKESKAPVGKQSCCVAAPTVVRKMRASMAESAIGADNVNRAFSGATEDVSQCITILVGGIRAPFPAHGDARPPAFWQQLVAAVLHTEGASARRHPAAAPGTARRHPLSDRSHWSDENDCCSRSRTLAHTKVQQRDGGDELPQRPQDCVLTGRWNRGTLQASPLAQHEESSKYCN